MIIKRPCSNPIIGLTTILTIKELLKLLADAYTLDPVAGHATLEQFLFCGSCDMPKGECTCVNVPDAGSDGAIIV